MEQSLSIKRLWSGLAGRLTGSGLQCGLLGLLAFLPIGGMALLAPDQIQAEGDNEFLLAAIVLSRLLTPPIAALMVAYLARKDKRLPDGISLAGALKSSFFPSIGLVLAVATFGFLATLCLVFPGVAFLLAMSVVLPVLVVEGVSGPQAVKRSWELTREHRWTLLAFWSGFFGIALTICSMVALTTTRISSEVAKSLPIVQTDSFLPLVVTFSFLYAAMIAASYEIHAQLIRIEAA